MAARKPPDLGDIEKLEEADFAAIERRVADERKRRRDEEDRAALNARKALTDRVRKHAQVLLEVFQLAHAEPRRSGCNDDNRSNYDNCGRCALLHLERFPGLYPELTFRFSVSRDELRDPDDPNWRPWSERNDDW